MPILRGLTEIGGQPLGPADAPTFRAFTVNAVGSSGILAATRFVAGGLLHRKWWSETVEITDADYYSYTVNTIKPNNIVIAVLARVTTVVPSTGGWIDIVDQTVSNYFTATQTLSTALDSTVIANAGCPKSNFGGTEATVKLITDPIPSDSTGRVKVLYLYEEFESLTS